MTNATSFGRQAATYAKGRPGYPPELYDWISGNSPSSQAVWDVGTGSGQAALALTDHFSAVYATDISKDQIAAAPDHTAIQYAVAAAQDSGLPEHWADAVTVATAVHWFADEAFWTEVARVAKADALFCAWTYQLPRSSPAIERDFLAPLLALLDPYWAEGNRICMAGYSAENLNCPLPLIETPSFDAGGDWDARRLINFVESWSAHLRAREDGKSDALEALQNKFLKAHSRKPISVSLPLSLLAARIN